MSSAETVTRFEIVVKKGIQEVAKIEAACNAPLKDISLADMQNVIRTEQFLEKLTGLRFHINQISPR